MKREGIKRRQKGFLAFLLAVIIGVLPTVEVWAANHIFEVSGDSSPYTIEWDANNISIGSDSSYSS